MMLAASLPICSAGAKGFKVVHTFAGGSDGSGPTGQLLRDKSGNLFGTTVGGGADGLGTVFELSAKGGENILHSFTGGSDGANPLTGLIEDSSGNLYGSTSGGGGTGCTSGAGCGIIFELAPDGTETILYSFTGGSDGASPKELLRDSKGNFYSTAISGGTYGAGTVFELTSGGQLNVLYTFTGGNDGKYPNSGVLMDKAGNLFGTTEVGGSSSDGTVFEVSANGTETTLYTFTDGNDGGYPETGLVADSAGNLYGAADTGGANGIGTIYEISPTGSETTLYSFSSIKDGFAPNWGTPVRDKSDNFYGTTFCGGGGKKNGFCGKYGNGVVYKVTPTGTESVLYSFTGKNDGSIPFGGLIMDSKGELFGTTSAGGNAGAGTVFELHP